MNQGEFLRDLEERGPIHMHPGMPLGDRGRDPRLPGLIWTRQDRDSERVRAHIEDFLAAHAGHRLRVFPKMDFWQLFCDGCPNGPPRYLIEDPSFKDLEDAIWAPPGEDPR